MKSPTSSSSGRQESWIAQAQLAGLEPIFDSNVNLHDSDDACDQRRLKRMAMLSIAFSGLSSILGPIGFVTGIFLGHAAYAQSANKPPSHTRRMAMGGLLISYGFALASATIVVIALMTWRDVSGAARQSLSIGFVLNVVCGVLYAAILAWLWLSARWGRTGLLCNMVFVFAVCFGSLAVLWTANAKTTSQQMRKSNQLREYGRAIQQYVDARE